jgi:hypothetical protein
MNPVSHTLFDSWESQFLKEEIQIQLRRELFGRNSKF